MPAPQGARRDPGRVAAVSVDPIATVPLIVGCGVVVNVRGAIVVARLVRDVVVYPALTAVAVTVMLEPASASTGP